MTNVRDVKEMLGLRARPVAIAFLAEPPAGLQPWRGGAKPAGCAFWQEAHSASFYTVPADHFNCAVGAYTHAIDLPPERSQELNQTIGFMTESEYIEITEVPAIPRLSEAPAVIAYSPADAATFAPDVVLLTVTPAQAMLVYEAAVRAGIPPATLMGRPSCAVLPFSLNADNAAVSLGCKGNRLYAGLRDDELYVAIPGAKWDDFRARLAEIIAANERMARFYADHEAQVAATGAR